MRYVRLWLGLGAVILGSFAVLGYYGWELYRQAPPIPERVVTTDGRELGHVSDVLHQPSGELLAVGDHLIPLIKDVVREVVPGERITVDPIPGLLD